MSSEALRRLSEWIDATTIPDFGGKSGNSGKSVEKSGLSSYHQNFPGGKSGKDDAERLTTLTTRENAVVRKETRSFNDLTTLTTLTIKNDDDLSAASVADALAWLSTSAHTVFIASPDGTVEVRHRQLDGQWSPPLIERLPPDQTRRIVEKTGAANASADAQPTPANGEEPADRSPPRPRRAAPFRVEAEHCPPEMICIKCGKRSDGPKGLVKKIADNRPGKVAVPLHIGCAEEWFDD